eukprot:2760476-Pyramimonas_sp.AAC.1
MLEFSTGPSPDIDSTDIEELAAGPNYEVLNDVGPVYLVCSNPTLRFVLMEMLGDWQVREKEKGDLLDRGGLQGARARVQSLLISSLLDKKESLRVEPSLYRWYGEGALNSLPPVVGSKAAGYEGHRLLKAPKSPGSAASVVGSDAANTGARLLNTAAIRGTRVDVRGTRVD